MNIDHIIRVVTQTVALHSGRPVTTMTQTLDAFGGAAVRHRIAHALEMETGLEIEASDLKDGDSVLDVITMVHHGIVRALPLAA